MSTNSKRLAALCVVWVLWSLPAQAAITSTGIKGNAEANTGTTVATGTLSVTSGNVLIVVGYVSDRTKTLSMSNSGTAATWTTLIGPVDDGSTNRRLYVFHGTLNATATITLTVTVSSGNQVFGCVAGEFAGLETTGASALDTYSGTANSTTTSHVASSVSMATDDELAVHGLILGTSRTFTADLIGAKTATLLGAAGSIRGNAQYVINPHDASMANPAGGSINTDDTATSYDVLAIIRPASGAKKGCSGGLLRMGVSCGG